MDDDDYDDGGCAIEIDRKRQNGKRVFDLNNS